MYVVLSQGEDWVSGQGPLVNSKLPRKFLFIRERPEVKLTCGKGKKMPFYLNHLHNSQ